MEEHIVEYRPGQRSLQFSYFEVLLFTIDNERKHKTQRVAKYGN